MTWVGGIALVFLPLSVAHAGGEAWSALAGPTPSYGRSLVYDSQRDRLIMNTSSGQTMAMTLGPSEGWEEIVAAGAPQGDDFMVYDAVQDRLLVLRVNGSSATWVLPLGSPAAWSVIGTSGPVPVLESAVHVPTENRVLAIESDLLYELNLSTMVWSQLATVNAPQYRRRAAMIYDPTRHALYRFGGQVFGSLGDHGYRNDTHKLDLASMTWTAVAVGPTRPQARDRMAAIYDSTGDRMIVFGGHAREAVTGTILPGDDTWVLPLDADTAWVELQSSVVPPGREWPGAVRDPVRDRMILWGGKSRAGAALLEDSWSMPLDTQQEWETLGPAEPSQRFGHSFVHERARNRIIMFGGHDGTTYLDETWILWLDPVRWEQVAPSGGSPQARWNHTAVLDTARNRMIVFGGYDGSASRNDAWTLDLGQPLEWTQLPVQGAAPPARSQHTAVLDASGDQMLVFAGETTPFAYANDTWSLSLTGAPTWSLESTTSAPTARGWHSAVYDHARGRMIVYGGWVAGAVLGDLWELSGGAWTQLVPSGMSPSPRFGHRAVIDPIEDRMIVIAGDPGMYDPPTEAWALDLGGTASWTELTPAGLPPQNLLKLHGATYSSNEGTVIVFGGVNANLTLTGDSTPYELWLGSTVDVPIRGTGASRGTALSVRPQPSRTTALIEFSTERSGQTEMEIVDVTGRRVAVRRLGHLGPGRHEIVWDGTLASGQRVHPGVYFVRVTQGDVRAAARTVRIR